MTTIIVNIHDTTFVSSAMPYNNYSNYPLIYTGTDTSLENCIGYLNIPLPLLPVSMVDSAKLQLSVITKSGAAASPITVNRVTQPFYTSSVTYNTQPTFEATTSSINVKTSDLYQTVEIDITTLVNQWINGTYTNNGIALTNSDGTTIVEFANNNIVYEPYFPNLVLSYSSTPIGPSSATNFSFAQLTHIIKQILVLYPTNFITIYTNGFKAATVTGTPLELNLSPDGTYGGVFVLDDNGNREEIPINAISAIYLGDSAVYNPAITFLTPPSFEEGYDKYILTGIHDNLSVSENVLLYMGSIIEASGIVYQNQYGMVVLSDGSGNTPVFIPTTTNITVILPTASGKETEKSILPRVTIVK